MRGALDRRSMGLPELHDFSVNSPLKSWIAKPLAELTIVIYPCVPDHTIFHSIYYNQYVLEYEVEGCDNTLGRMEDSARGALYLASKHWLKCITGTGTIIRGACTLVNPHIDDVRDMPKLLLIYLVDLLKEIRGSPKTRLP
jgi:hypothetical protein